MLSSETKAISRIEKDNEPMFKKICSRSPIAADQTHGHVKFTIAERGTQAYSLSLTKSVVVSVTDAF